MSNAISGGLTLSSSLVQQLDAGANRIDPYTVPVQPSLSATYAPGTAAGQANRLAQASGTATAAPVDIDLSTIACVDGSAGFSHVRELVVLNLDAAHPLTVGPDGVVSNPWTAYALGTNPRVLVEPGAPFRVSKPLGTNGYAVDGTHKLVRVDPGANTVAYQVIALGD